MDQRPAAQARLLSTGRLPAVAAFMWTSAQYFSMNMDDVRGSPPAACESFSQGADFRMSPDSGSLMQERQAT
jgi:hypothetical protein